jgi:hypothetical protein
VKVENFMIVQTSVRGSGGRRMVSVNLSRAILAVYIAHGPGDLFLSAEGLWNVIIQSFLLALSAIEIPRASLDDMISDSYRSDETGQSCFVSDLGVRREN